VLTLNKIEFPEVIFLSKIFNLSAAIKYPQTVPHVLASAGFEMIEQRIPPIFKISALL